MKNPFESEKALWLALSKENTHAIRFLYKKHFRVWISWMTQRGGNQQDGEDVFQEALLILIEKSKDSNFSLSAQISTLLIAICKRIWFKKIQKIVPETGNTDSLEDEFQIDDSELLEEHFVREKKYELLNEALLKLGEPCASLLKSYYILDKSMNDIAKEFSYTNADNAKTQKYKCLTRLKKLFFNAYQHIEEKEFIIK